MGRVLTYRADVSGQTVKRFLYAHGYTSSVITMLKKSERGIMLGGERVFVDRVLSVGDVLEISLDEPLDDILKAKESYPPQQLGFTVLYEDEDIIAYDKPPLVAVHPTKKIQSGTLANDFAYHLQQRGEAGVFRPVYRLDRGTSGVVIAAKNKLACALLSGKTSKRYLCVCVGELPEKGTFDGNIGLSDSSTLKRAVRPDGQTAVTHFDCLCSANGLSLARVTLETGRTHQIRVHFSHAGFPLLGDFLYGEESALISRHALHCETAEFTHPITGEKVTLTSPLPNDISSVCEKYNLFG